MSAPETLAFNPALGEVDPRTYHLLGHVRLACEKIGDHERIAQANRLIYAIDKLCESEGESRVRVHLTRAPGGNPRHAIEVRIQQLSDKTIEAEAATFARIKNRWNEVLAQGDGRWVAV